MPFRRLAAALGVAALALLPAAAMARPAGLPDIQCGVPLPDPFLAAVALQPSDLPDGWRLIPDCIITPPQGASADSPRYLAQLAIGGADLSAAAQGGPIQPPLVVDVTAVAYPADTDAAAAFPVRVAGAHTPVVDVTQIVPQGEPPPQIMASMQAFDLAAPMVGDEAAELELDVTETENGRSSLAKSTVILFRRGPAIVTVDVEGDDRREALVLELAQTLDAHVQAALASQPGAGR